MSAKHTPRTVVRWRGFDASGNIIVEVTGKLVHRRSAAPDMLAALKAALRRWHADGRNFYKTEPAWLAQARAAIAKATGNE